MRYLFTLPLARRSPLQVPRRNLVVAGSDDLSLGVTLVEADAPGAAAVEMRSSDALLRLAVWHGQGLHDYGCWWSARERLQLLLSADAVVSDTVLGLCTFTIARNALALRGRSLFFSITYDDGFISEICWGRMHVHPGLARTPPVAVSLLLNDDYTPILTDNSMPIEV